MRKLAFSVCSYPEPALGPSIRACAHIYARACAQANAYCVHVRAAETGALFYGSRGDEDFFEHNDYLVGIAYFEEFNQDVEPDTLVSA